MNNLVERLRERADQTSGGEFHTQIMNEAADTIEQQAKDIQELVSILSTGVNAYEAGALEMSSPEIGGGHVSPHPWHEEWLAFARATLSKHMISALEQ